MRGITFTRSRSYWKNDNCHVEQKNGHLARRVPGYFRYDREEALEVLKELTRVASLFTNFFKPSMKLKKKIHEGSRIRRIYDTPRPPYLRVLEDPTVPEEVKERLRKQFKEIKLGALIKEILRLQQALFALASPVEVDHEHV